LLSLIACLLFEPKRKKAVGGRFGGDGVLASDMILGAVAAILPNTTLFSNKPVLYVPLMAAQNSSEQ